MISLANFVEEALLIEEQIKSLKQGLLAFYADKSIPLDVRWQAFEDAPDYTKESRSWITRFEGLPDDFVEYDGIVHAERHETVNISRIMDALNEIDEDDLAQIDVVAFKEDVLSKNMKSFKYDW